MSKRLGFNEYGVLEWVAEPPRITAGAPATHQINFRVRDDTAGLNTDSGWLAAEDTNPSAISWNTPFRIRFTLDEVNNKVTTCTPTLYANYNGGGYVLVNATSTYVEATASGQYADNATTSQLLSSGASGTFLAGTADEVDGAVALLNFAKDQFTEVEFCVQFVEADVTAGHTCLFQVRNGTTVLESYTATPTIEVAAGASAYTIAGDVTVTPIVAATMDATLNHVIAGNVTVTPTIAAAMAYAVGQSLPVVLDAEDGDTAEWDNVTTESGNTFTATEAASMG